jgi:hypothetical protein
MRHAIGNPLLNRRLRNRRGRSWIAGALRRLRRFLLFRRRRLSRLPLSLGYRLDRRRRTPEKLLRRRFLGQLLL